MYKDLIEKKQPVCLKALEFFQSELNSVRTGRASPGLVENLLVESYGVSSPLKNLASITIPDSRSIAIQPWDRQLIGYIEKAIRSSNLGLQPSADGQFVRLNLPPLNEERRKELVKLVRQHAESARVRIRNIREEIWKEAIRLEKEKKMTEDEKYQVQEDLKKLVEDYNGQIRSLLEKKEQEIMTV